MRSNFSGYLDYHKRELSNPNNSVEEAFFTKCQQEILSLLIYNPLASEPPPSSFIYFHITSDSLPYDNLAIDKFVDRFHSLLTEGESIEEVIKNWSQERKGEKPQEIKNFVSSLFNYTCEEILNDSCEVQADIIKTLEYTELDEKVFAPVSHYQPSIASEKFLGIYFKNILIVAVKEGWQKKYGKTYLNDKASPVYLIKIIQETFQFDADLSLRRKSLSYPIFGNDVTKICAEIIADMPAEQIQKMIDYDFQPLTEAQRKLITANYYNDLMQAKVNFWLVVAKAALDNLNSYIKQIDKNREIFEKSIEGDLPEKNSIQSMKIDADRMVFANWRGTTLKNIKTIEDTLNDYVKSSNKNSFFSSRHANRIINVEFPFRNNYPLYKWFSLRDNEILLKNILAQETKKPDIFHNDCAIKAELQASLSCYMILTLEPRFILPLLKPHCLITGEIKKIMDNFQEFFNTIETYAKLNPVKAKQSVNVTPSKHLSLNPFAED